MAHRCNGLRTPDRGDDGAGRCRPFPALIAAYLAWGFHAGHRKRPLRAWCRSLRCPERKRPRRSPPTATMPRSPRLGPIRTTSTSTYPHRLRQRTAPDFPPGTGFQSGLVAGQPVDRVYPRWSPRSEQGDLVPPHGGQERSLARFTSDRTMPSAISLISRQPRARRRAFPAPDKPDALFVMSIETREKEALSYPPAADVFTRGRPCHPAGARWRASEATSSTSSGSGAGRASTPPEPLAQRALGTLRPPPGRRTGGRYASAGAL